MAGCQRFPGTGGTSQSLKEQGPPHVFGVLGNPNSMITLGSLHPLCTRGGTPQFPERPEHHAGNSCTKGDPDSLQAQHNSSNSLKEPQLSQGPPNPSRDTNCVGDPTSYKDPQLRGGGPNSSRGPQLLQGIPAPWYPKSFKGSQNRVGTPTPLRAPSTSRDPKIIAGSQLLYGIPSPGTPTPVADPKYKEVQLPGPRLLSGIPAPWGDSNSYKRPQLL